MHFGRAIGLILLAVSLGCGRFGAVYPSRPSPSPGVPAADPMPSRIVAHVAMSGASLRDALDGAVPRSGAGDFALLKSQRHYTWDRAASPRCLAHGENETALEPSRIAGL